MLAPVPRQLIPVGQALSSVQSCEQYPEGAPGEVGTHSAVAHSLARAQLALIQPAPAGRHTRSVAVGSRSGKQPCPGTQPPRGVQFCTQVGGAMEVSQVPERQLLVPVAGQVVPEGSEPRTSEGGTQTIIPLRTSQVYGGKPSPGSRVGQSAAVAQRAVQPSPPAPQKPRALGHWSAVAQGISICTHTRCVAVTGEHAKPEGQSAAVEQLRVQCVAEPEPTQKDRQGAAVLGLQPGAPVSSTWQVPRAHTCPVAQSVFTMHVRVQKRGTVGVHSVDAQSVSEVHTSR